VNVVLLERSDIGGQASGAAAGLLAPLGPLSGPGPFADLVLAGFSRLVELVPELEEVSGVQVGFERTGALRVVRNPKRVAHLQKRMERWQPLGLQMYWLSGDEARRREPLLTSDVCAAVYAPEESQISASHVVQAYARAAQNMGVDIRPQQEVDTLVKSDARVTEVHTKQGARIGCNFVILASGAWATQCAEEFDVALPISPLHGQLLSLPQTSQHLQHILFGDAGYLVPRGNSILVGATKEERGFDHTVTEQGTN
jgi:glycine oxidase